MTLLDAACELGVIRDKLGMLARALDREGYRAADGKEFAILVGLVSAQAARLATEMARG